MTIIKKGVTDQTFYVKMIDSSTGVPKTNLDITLMDATYTRYRRAAVKNDLTSLTSVDAAHTDNRALVIDTTNAPGLYRVDFPDAAFASSSDVPMVILTVTHASADPTYTQVQLIDFDPFDGVRMGLTALPNAAADAAGGLPISDAGGLDLDAKLANTNEVTTARMGALTDWIDGGRLDLLLDGVKAKTDSLTFTVANVVDANIQRINDVTIVGDGSGTPFNV